MSVTPRVTSITSTSPVHRLLLSHVDVGDITSVQLVYHRMPLFDWWMELNIDDVTVTSGVSSQHFRSVEDPAQTTLRTGEATEVPMREMAVANIARVVKS